MANISIYDPLNTRLNRFFNQFFTQPSAFGQQEEILTLQQPKLDITENEKNYLVQADLPGVKKDNIRVEVNGDQIVISAELKKFHEEQKNKNLIHSERYEGKVFRSFNLGCHIDESSVQARYTDGVLELTLPKKSGDKGAKRIQVQ